MKKKIISLILSLLLCCGNATIVKAAEQYVYSTTYLNVRESSNVNSNKAGILKPNSKILRIKKGKKWDVIKIDNKKYFVYNKYITKEKPNKIVKVKTLDDLLTQDKSDKTYLGYFKLTAYCGCSRCCGSNGGRVTSSGTIPTAGRTVGCNGIAAGTHININGHSYIVEDTGNTANNVIDIYMNSHQEALNFGVKYANVYKEN